jgi:hypothetical protein
MTRHSRESGKRQFGEANPAYACPPKGSGTPAFAGVTKKEIE